MTFGIFMEGKGRGGGYYMKMICSRLSCYHLVEGCKIFLLLLILYMRMQYVMMVLCD